MILAIIDGEPFTYSITIAPDDYYYIYKLGSVARVCFRLSVRKSK